MRKIKAFLRIFLTASVLFGMLRVGVAAAESVALSVFQGKNDYKVFFDWHGDTDFEQSLDDNNVFTLSFLKKNDASVFPLRKITDSLPKNLRRWNVDAAADRLTLTLKLPPSYAASAQKEETVVVLTLFPADKTVKQTVDANKSDGTAKKDGTEKTEPLIEKTETKKNVVVADAPIKEPAKEPAPPPAANEESDKEREQSYAVAKQLLDSFDEETTTVQAVDVTTPQGLTDDKSAQNAKQDFSAAKEGGYRIAMLSFPWPKMTALAAFRRDGYLWLVFDRKGTFDFDTELRIYKDIIHEMVEIPHSRATIFRLVTAEGYNPSFRREGLLWVVDLMYQPLRPKNGVDLVLQRKTPFGPRLFIPLSETPDVIPVLDPEVGDLMFIVPLFSLNKGVSRFRSFIDADFLTTAQGIVIVPKSDEVATFTSNAGLEIRVPQTGMRFSSEDILAFLAKTKVTKDPMEQILDVGVWFPDEGDFWKTAATLKKNVVTAEKKDKNVRRLILARYYFAHGMYPETLGILGVISQNSSEFAQTAPFLALRGAANYMMRRYEEALPDLSDSSLRKNQAADFWRAAVKAEMSKNPEMFLDKMKENMGVLQTYPASIKTRLALTGLRAAVHKRDEPAVQNFIEIAYGTQNTPAENAAADFYYALWQEYLGMYNQAVKLMTKLANGTDLKYSAFGGLEKIRMEARLKRTEVADRIKELERLLYAWRDGDFEYNLMTQLVAAYEEQKDYTHVLYLLKDMQVRYRDRPEVKSIPELMEEVFQKLYLDEDSNERLTPVKAIAVYDEFRDLVPSGDKGVRIARNLADRLTAIDLLDKAAELLEDQLRSRIPVKEKGLVGTRLALVYLLNKEPKNTLSALKRSEIPNFPEQTLAQRRYIKAKALKETGSYDEAVDLLKNDASYESRILQAEIYWAAKQWDKAADTFKLLIKRPVPNVPLTDAEARGVLDWATALRLAGRAKVVVRLRENFLPYMKNTPYAESFDFITQSPQKGLMDYKTVSAEVKMAERFNESFKKHLDRLKTEMLSDDVW